MIKASEIIKALPNKFKPLDDERVEIGEENITRTDTDLESQDLRRMAPNTPFNKDTKIKTYKDGFRIFGKKLKTNDMPVGPTQTINIERRHQLNTTIVYTDGSCKNNGDQDAKAGAGVWYANNDQRNMTIKIPNNMEQSNNSGELVAILRAIQNTETTDILQIHTDSQYSLSCTQRIGLAMERHGWIGTANKETIKAILAHLRTRKGETYFIKVKGHSGDTGNDGADKLADIGAEKDNSDDIDLSIPENYEIEGAQFSIMTQADLYRGIREKKTERLEQRKATRSGLNITRWAVKSRWNRTPTDKLIWRSIRNPDIDRKIRAFLYNTIHQSLRIGPYWERIPEHDHRVMCSACETQETLAHILEECRVSGQDTVWKLAAATLRNRGITLGNVTLGDAMACAMADNKKQNRKPDTALNRLMTIVMSESLYTIWLIRCKWVISKGSNLEDIIHPNEVEALWRTRINKRIRVDQTMASKKIFKWKKVTRQMVLNTWSKTLQNEEVLPNNWIWSKGVLVGAGSVSRPPGRNR